MAVIVLGSLNQDVTLRTSHLPGKGETIKASTREFAPGGKGANQAVAAGRALAGSGIAVRMCGRVGDDEAAQMLLDSLRDAGVDTAGVVTDRDRPTGTAYITLDDEGDNTIVLDPAANDAVDAEDVSRAADLLDGENDFVLLQQEIPSVAVRDAAVRLGGLGATVLLDPAPATGALDDDFLRSVHWLLPNGKEASALLNFEVNDLHSAKEAARALLDRGVGRGVVVKLGGDGLVWTTREDGPHHIPRFQVDAVDTVGAGDATAGYFAAGLAEGLRVDVALRRAAAAAALSTTKRGAQPAMPTRDAVEKLLKTK